MVMIRILVVPPATRARVEYVESTSWRTWYPLVAVTTHNLECRAITTHIDLLCDEAAQGWMPANVLLPSHDQLTDFTLNFMVDMTGMKFNVPHVGYRVIHGTFLLTRHDRLYSTDLRDLDISRFVEKFACRRLS